VAKEQSCNNGIGTLASAIADGTTTTLTLTDLTGLPAAAPFNIRIEDEILRVTAVNAGTKQYTVTRGAEGTTAAAHAAALSVYHPLTLAGLKRWNEQSLNGTATANQRGLNFINGSGIAITLAEDAANENCNCTIALATSPALTGTPTAPTATAGTNTTQVATTAFVTSALATLAPLASPAFTGTPTAPTATAGTNTTQLATTAFVAAAVAGVAPLASPAFTGTPTAPTATAGTNTTQIATTAYVVTALSGVVQTTGNQTVAGNKTFSGTTQFSGAVGIQGTGSYPLVVKAGGSAGFAFDAGNQIFGTTFGSGGNFTIKAEDPASNNGGQIFFGGSTRGDDQKSAVTFLINNTEYVRFDGDQSGHTVGNLGVRTKFPHFPVSVVGSVGFQASSSSTTDRNQGRITPAWLDNTDGTRKGRVSIFAADSTGTDREGVRVESDGTQAVTTVLGPAIFSKKATIPCRDGAIASNTDGATVTFDLSLSDRHTLTLGGNRTLALSNDTVGQELTLILTQDATGSRTVTWWSGIKWPGGTAPTLSTAAGALDVFTFLKTGAGSYLGFVKGQNLS
jgi:hypothetical protein